MCSLLSLRYGYITEWLLNSSRSSSSRSRIAIVVAAAAVVVDWWPPTCPPVSLWPLHRRYTAHSCMLSVAAVLAQMLSTSDSGQNDISWLAGVDRHKERQKVTSRLCNPTRRHAVGEPGWAAGALWLRSLRNVKRPAALFTVSANAASSLKILTAIHFVDGAHNYGRCRARVSEERCGYNR